MKATTVVHWPGQDVLACDAHAAQLKKAGEVIGCPISTTPLAGPGDCSNCLREQLDRAVRKMTGRMDA